MSSRQCATDDDGRRRTTDDGVWLFVFNTRLQCPVCGVGACVSSDDDADEWSDGCFLCGTTTDDDDDDVDDVVDEWWWWWCDDDDDEDVIGVTRSRTTTTRDEHWAKDSCKSISV